MALVPVICAQCGAQIEVDNMREAGICKYCGTAFVIEKAINNCNVRNNVNVQSGGNSISITAADQSNKYIMMARKYKINGDSEKAQRFYTLALEGQPDSWEANFYSAYYSAIRAELSDMRVKANQMQSSTIVSIELIKINVPNDGVIVCISEMQRRLMELSACFFNSYRAFWLRNKKYTHICKNYNYAVQAIVGILYRFGEQLGVHFFSNRQIMDIAVDSWKYALSIRKKYSSDKPLYYNSGNGDSKSSIQAEIDYYAGKIKAFDPAYKAPKAKGRSKACYIATCVYGSYDCPQVWTLRRFRDDTLNGTWYGRAFIKCYYAVSPTLVKWFGNYKWFRTFWKKYLDKMVKKLNRLGVENTQYYDEY